MNIFRMIEQKRGSLLMLRAWMIHKKDKTSPTVSGGMAVFKTRMAEAKRIHDYHAYGPPAMATEEATVPNT